MAARSTRLSGGRRAVALLVPWLFVAAYLAVYVAVLLPRAAGGGVLGAAFAVLVGLVLLSFVVAAVTFSRDVLAGRYP